MAPPAKRRRNTVHNSEDDSQPSRPGNTLANFLLSSPEALNSSRPPTASPSPVKRKTALHNPEKAATRTSRPAKSQKNGTSSSPRKARSGLTEPASGKTADLKTLFSKQEQRSRPERRNTPIEDLISDPISEDDEISELKVSSSSLVGQHARKRLRSSGQAVGSEAPRASQVFMKPSKPNRNEPLDDDLRPWSERFRPRSLEELAVHKKKVADVRKWLEDVVGGRMRQRLLILKGPAGSGKTTTLRLLAEAMCCELLEWKNPVGNAGTGFVSATAQFDEFLNRGYKFGGLELDISESLAPLSTSLSALAGDEPRRIIMIEEFPNTFSRSSSALSSFRSSVLHYLQSQTPSLAGFGRQVSSEPIKPIVMIISETLLTTTSASADSFTAHRLLGPEILGHPGVGVIEFNTIAPTIMLKALELVVQKEARKSGRRKTPGPQVLTRIGQIGDIRSAISSLEFLCLKGDQEADWGAKVTFTKQKKGAKDGVVLTRGEEESLEMVSQREASLGIFHAVGKIVYNKRDTAPSGDPAEQLSSWLSNYSRPNRSEVSVDALLDETGTDTHTFISALHENYVPSCECSGPRDRATSMDYVNECIELLSQSDLLCPTRDVFFGGSGGFASRDSGSHVLRQDEITFQVAVRGLLFSLPNPVRRKMNGTAKGADAFKMFYPQSLKLWRAREEIEGLVDLWSTKLLQGEVAQPAKSLTDGASAFRRSNQQSADLPWMHRQTQGSHPIQQASSRASAEAKGSDQSSTLVSLGTAARREMLLDRLPYMAQIARGRKVPIRLRELEKITSFSGAKSSTDQDASEELEDNDVMTGEAWATDRPSEEQSPRKRRTGVKAGGVSGMLAHKLVLSDDDIED